MDFAAAAVLIGAYGTAYHALTQRAALQSGERLLVLGAAGGVGLAAVQLGCIWGARVIAACATAERAQIARDNGAAAAFVYPREANHERDDRALRMLFKEHGPYDVVFDPLGGNYSEASLRSLSYGGRLLVVGFTAGIPRIATNLALLKECQIVGVFYGAFAAREPARDAENVATLFRLYREGRIRPHISARYPLAAGAQALGALAERRVTGRVLIEMHPQPL
jgi:NADPH:quinone reductase